MAAPKQINDTGLPWPPLVRGRLIKRYKRFLADVILDDGAAVTAHCPNSGRMTGCNTSGQPVYLSIHDNPRRKLKYTWEIIEMPTSLVGVNTQVPNRLVARALRDGCVPALKDYNQVTKEVATSDNTRLDLKLTAGGMPQCYVEIKNCTLVEDGCAMFPDAPTLRGQKHLRELLSLRANGDRAVIFFLIQRTDARFFLPADSIDPEYGRLLREVIQAGVEIMAYDVTIDLEHIALHRQIPCRL